MDDNLITPNDFSERLHEVLSAKSHRQLYVHIRVNPYVLNLIK